MEQLKSIGDILGCVVLRFTKWIFAAKAFLELYRRLKVLFLGWWASWGMSVVSDREAQDTSRIGCHNCSVENASWRLRPFRLRRTRTRYNATTKATPQLWTGKRWDRNLSSLDHLSMCHSGGVTASFKLKRGWRSRMNTSDQATGGLCRCIGSRDRPANGFELGTRWGVLCWFEGEETISDP